MKPLMRVLGWAAVSSVDQAGDDKYSIPSQIQSINDFCEKQRDKYDVVLVDTVVIGGHSRKFRTFAELVANAEDPDVRASLDRFAQHISAADFDVLVCRDANRFARKSSLLHQIADLVIEDCKARIYSFGDGWGWVDETNVDAWLVVKGYETRQQSRWIAKSMQEAKRASLETGLPHSGQVCWSHIRIRDQTTGKNLRIVPDPAKQYILRKAAEVLVHGVLRFAHKPVLARLASRPIHSPLRWRHPPMVLTSISYRKFERILWVKYRIGRNNQPFPHNFFYHLFWNPTFHGHKAINHKNINLPNGQKVAPWVYDPSFPLPDGVLIRYGIVEPALPPELLSLLQSELHRRYEIGQRYRTENTHKFTGLIICGICGHNMVFDNNKRRKPRWTCQSKYLARQEPRCNTKHGIRQEVIEEWMTTRIKEAIENNWATLFEGEQPAFDLNQIKTLTSEIKRIEGEADNLVTALRKSPPELVDTFHRQLSALASELTSLKKALARAEREFAERNRDNNRVSLDALSVYENITDFWKDDENRINQILRRIMGKRRIVVVNHHVLGSRLA